MGNPARLVWTNKRRGNEAKWQLADRCDAADADMACAMITSWHAMIAGWAMVRAVMLHGGHWLSLGRSHGVVRRRYSGKRQRH